MRVLVVEDDREAAGWLVKGLKEEGHVVDHAANGPDGLTMAREQVHDVIIMDRMLPGMDGLTAVDDCDGTVAVRWSAGPVTGDCAKSQTFTYSAVDSCGNSASDTVTYTWKEDVTDPVLPTLPRTSPLRTSCPSSTRTLERWAYSEYNPSP